MAQQLVIMSRKNPPPEGGMAPIGTREEIIEMLERENTAADEEGGDVLWGPGIQISLPPTNPIPQMLLSIVEDEIAWLVIMKLARKFNWRLIDTDSGREFTPADGEVEV